MHVLDHTAPPLPADERPGPGRTVDCSAAPCNLRPALDAIMEAENWILERMPEDRRLVIVFGEGHSYQTHQFLQQALLLRHKEQAQANPERSFAYGYEFEKKFWKRCPRDSQIQTAFEILGQTLGLEQNQDHPEVYLNVFQKLEDTHDLKSAKSLIAFCQKEGISVSFNDATSKTNLESMHIIMDLEDEQVRRIVASHDNINNRGEIYAIGQRGMYVRNIAIAENAMEHIAQTNAKIYIQHCGQGHAHGAPDKGLPYEQSLCAQFRKQDVEVLSVMFKCDPERYRLDIPDIAEERPYTIVIENMAPALSAIYDHNQTRISINRASGLNL